MVKLIERGVALAVIRDQFEYMPGTGDLVRRSTGQVTGSTRRDGYKQVGVGRRSFAVHRIAWALHWGTWPEGDIDHINGDPADNRIANLRDVPHSVNQRNLRRAKNSSTGVTGVYVHTETRRFVARIKIGGVTRTLGSFKTLEEAAQARAEANASHGFSMRHGEQA